MGTEEVADELVLERAVSGCLPWLSLAVIGNAQLMVMLDPTVMNVALPSAQRALHVTTADRQCVDTFVFSIKRLINLCNENPTRHLDLDSEKFAEIVRRLIFDHSNGERVLHEAHAVIEQIERWDPPFSEPWPDCRPDMRWPVPGLVEGWDEAK